VSSVVVLVVKSHSPLYWWKSSQLCWKQTSS